MDIPCSIQDYKSCIAFVRDKKCDITYDLSNIDIEMLASKYSNTKMPIYKMIINKSPISRNNSLTVGFKCITCGIQREITLNLFMRKVQSSSKSCLLCCNKEENKCKNHSSFMMKNFDTIHSGDYESEKVHPTKLTLEQKIQHSDNEWEEEDTEYKTAYFLKHLTISEFDNIRNKIIGINNMKLTNITDWSYYPYFRIFNQTKYTPMLVNFSKSMIERPQYITFKCECCENEFVHRDLYIVKNKIKVFCKDCSLSNRTFKVRKHILKDGSIITWQSTPEKRFIDWCEDNKISIQNGPKLKYLHNGVEHIYKVDFVIPDRHLLIEIKDNHCWYRQQIKNGKQPAKELAMKEYCEANNFEYYIIFPKTLSKCKELILNKVL